MRNSLIIILLSAVCFCGSAQAAQKTIGTICNSDNSNIDWDTIGQCNGAVFQKGPLMLGAVATPAYTSTTCDGTKAGMLQWTGTSFKSCNGSGWMAFGEGSFLGVSATNTAPSRNGDITTGLFSDTASTVSIATAGVSRLTVAASGYVGIGVVQPTVDLTIGGSSFGLQRGNASPNSGFLRFGDNTGWKFHIGRMSETVSGAVNTDLTGALVTFTDRGNVGIGITSPAHALDVVGNINLSGYRIGSPRTGMTGYSGGDYSSTGYGYVPTTTSGQYLYGVNDLVSRLEFRLGGFAFKTAPSGTTGNAITFSEPMTILNSGNVGIGSTAPGYKLDVNGGTKTASLDIGGMDVERTFAVNFNNTANEKVDLIIPNDWFWGSIEVSLTSTYSYQNAPGIISKRFALGLGPSGNIYTNQSRYTEVLGNTPDAFAISDLTWDSANSRYRIQIVHRSSSANPAWITVRGLVMYPSYVNNMTLGSIYTSDTTVFAYPMVSFSSVQLAGGGNLYLGGGSTYKLSSNDAYLDTLNTGVTSDPLEINYRVAGPVKICTSVNCGGYSVNFGTDGNLTFGFANPYLTASSYMVIPGGAYFNSGTVYTEATIQARGGIHDDTHANLTIYGGTSGHTAFSGTVSASTPTASNHLATKAYVDSVAGGGTPTMISAAAYYGTAPNVAASCRTANIACQYMIDGSSCGSTTYTGWRLPTSEELALFEGLSIAPPSGSYLWTRTHGVTNGYNSVYSPGYMLTYTQQYNNGYYARCVR
ncbi:MAG: hypothetical protein PHX43_08325 [Alphaproteobacteria bacterium]|nr:hypothetical protein [Alphaproteobacteria bacterium]